MESKTHFSKIELLKKTVFSFEILMLIIVGIIGLILLFNTESSVKRDIFGLISVFAALVVGWIIGLFAYRNYVLNDILKQLQKNDYTVLDFTLTPTQIEFQKNQQAFILKTDDISLKSIDFVFEPTNRIKTKHKSRNKWKRESRTYFYTPKVTKKLLDFAEQN